MSELNKPLYALTVEEYIELNNKIYEEHVAKLLAATQLKEPIKKESEIIFINELVTLTGYTKSTIYTKISKNEIPVLSRRTPLTFSRKEILKWIKEGKPSAVEMEAEEYLKKRNKNSKFY